MDGSTNGNPTGLSSTTRSNSSPEQRATESAALSPELVREVTEKVYALMLQDLKLAHERLGYSHMDFRYNGGR